MGSRLKSAWGKYKSHKEAENTQANDASEITDFLRPSTDKAQLRHAALAPKIDIAIAQRFSDRDDHGQDTQGADLGDGRAWIPLKPRRREGLTVVFARTAPEVMGEGGDEAPDPPSEISRQKAALSRSHSDYRPRASTDGASWAATHVPPATWQEPAPSIHRPTDEDFVPKPLRRANTSHNELSPPVQKRQAAPEPLSHESTMRLRRTPTGFSSGGDDDDDENSSPVEPQGHEQTYLPKMRPLPSKFEFEPDLEEHPTSSRPPRIAISGTTGDLSPLPHSPAYASSQGKRREMRANEGAALRRLSGMNFMENDGDIDPQLESQLARDQLVPEAPRPQIQPPSHPNSLPQSAILPTNSKSPFADPKYFAKPPPDIAGSETPTSVPPPQRQNTGTSPFDDPKYIKRRSGEQGPLPLAREIPIRERRQASNGSQHNANPPYPTTYHGEPTQPTQNSSKPRNTSPNAGTGTLKNFSRPRQQPLATSEPQPRPDALSDNSIVNNTAGRERSPLRDRIFNGGPSNTKANAFYHRQNSSGTSVNHFAPVSAHSPTASQADGLVQPKAMGSADQASQQLAPARQHPNHSYTSPESQLNPTYLSARPAPSPYARNPSPADYFSNSRNPPSQAARSPAANLRQQENDRPGSAGSNRSLQPMQRASPVPSQSENSQAANAALADFAGRVAHMKGVFRLTAEKEKPADRCTPLGWLRTAVWWFLEARCGLDDLFRQRARSPGGDQHRELLTQAHVDLAKAWWILYEKLDVDETIDTHGFQEPVSNDVSGTALARRSGVVLRDQIASLTVSMGSKQLLPPYQSLIQGQNTMVWLDYPRFPSYAAAALGGGMGLRPGDAIEASGHALDPLEALPIRDTRDIFCYGRFHADVHLSTNDPQTDRVNLSCIVSMIRGKRDIQASIVIASQDGLVNVRISPRRGEDKGPSWHDVSWKSSAYGIGVRLSRDLDLNARFSERDYRALWNFVEYTRKLEQGFRPMPNERSVHEVRLVEAQYLDSSNAGAFPQGLVPGCVALLFEKSKEASGHETRRMHRGFRFLLVTEPGHKTLSSVSHDLCADSPLHFEFRTDSENSTGHVAMVLRIRENTRQIRVLLTFADANARQRFHDRLNALNVEQGEAIICKAALRSLNIEPATQTSGFSEAVHPALQSLQWQKLGVTNASTGENESSKATIMSSSLRVLARHQLGCITDYLNMSKGELMLRLPSTGKPVIQILREAQEDLTMSLDTRTAEQYIVDGLGELYRLVKGKRTIRTLTFASAADLHSFQLAITGFQVRYDGLASSFSISRRRMVVPIYKKWEASQVRMQVVANAQQSVTQVLAFMEDFSHADAMVFQVKKTDDFENAKSSTGKDKKWSVKLKDAKFSLPNKEGKGEVDEEEDNKVRQRFVNLEGLEYAEEHDDITVGFETEEERDRFAQALPAATTVGRGLTLKRRI